MKENIRLISYFDLLDMFRFNRQPYKVKLYICNYSMTYIFSDEDGSYIIEDRKKVSQRFNFYLNENLTEICCLKKIIEIIK